MRGELCYLHKFLGKKSFCFHCQRAIDEAINTEDFDEWVDANADGIPELLILESGSIQVQLHREWREELRETPAIASKDK